MMQKKLKTIAMYGVILAAGLGSGYALSLLPGLFKSNYTEGNYAAYFPNAQAKVVLYGTDWCGYCAKTRAYFKENKIDAVVRLLEATSPEVPEGVPWAGEFLKSAEDLEVLRVLTTAMELGRSYVMSGQVPADPA